MLGIARQWLAVLFISFIWTFLSKPAHKNLETLSAAPANILLLTAHPDDECMFFAPTVIALLHVTTPPPTLYSLCLSVGNADGLGDIRRHELARSLDVLGIEEGRRWVIDTPELQDNFTALWEPEVIAGVLMPYVLENHINIILTFDHKGISSHPNHISLPNGASHLLSTLHMTNGSPQPRLFTLVTVPLYEKYLGLLSPILSKASIMLSHVSGRAGASSRDASVTVAVADWRGYLRAHRAMRQHWSQLVWFRWLYVSFSRYMWVNEWAEVLPSGGALTADQSNS